MDNFIALFLILGAPITPFAIFCISNECVKARNYGQFKHATMNDLYNVHLLCTVSISNIGH